MQRNVFTLFLVAAIHIFRCVDGQAAPITFDEGANAVRNLSFTPKMGLLVLCENDIAGGVCVGGLNGISDEVAFDAELKRAGLISDPDNDLSGSTNSDAVKLLDPANVENPLFRRERDIVANGYTATAGQPGYDTTNNQNVQYAFDIDTLEPIVVAPEPGSLTILGMGVLGLAIFGRLQRPKERH